MCFYKCPSCEAEMNQHDKPSHACPDTTNDFTTAARAEAERANDMSQWDRDCFMAGAEWARDHLAAQEVTDADVLVAMTAYEGHPDRVSAWRAALTAAKEARA